MPKDLDRLLAEIESAVGAIIDDIIVNDIPPGKSEKYLKLCKILAEIRRYRKSH